VPKIDCNIIGDVVRRRVLQTAATEAVLPVVGKSVLVTEFAQTEMAHAGELISGESSFSLMSP
jgi:hypothetical protein